MKSKIYLNLHEVLLEEVVHANTEILKHKTLQLESKIDQLLKKRLLNFSETVEIIPAFDQLNEKKNHLLEQIDLCKYNENSVNIHFMENWFLQLEQEYFYLLS